MTRSGEENHSPATHLLVSNLGLGSVPANRFTMPENMDTHIRKSHHASQNGPEEV